MKSGAVRAPPPLRTRAMLCCLYTSTSALLELFWEFELLLLPTRTSRSPGFQAAVAVVATAVSRSTWTPLAVEKVVSMSSGAASSRRGSGIGAQHIHRTCRGVIELRGDDV